MRTSFASIGLLILAFLSGCHSQSTTSRSALAREHVSAPPTQPPPNALKPLPKMPPVSVAQVPVPGATGTLEVVAAKPRGAVKGKILPTITFSQPVMTLAMVEQAGTRKPVARIDPPIEGTWRWLGSSSVEFEPKAPVPYSTHYTVTVLHGLRALNGSVLAHDYVFQFSTPVLALQDVSPSRGDSWLKPDQEIRLLFNQPVDPAALAKAASFVVEGEVTPLRAQVLSSQSIADERAARSAKQGHAPSGPAEVPGSHFENRQVRYVLAPERPFPKDRAITLNIAATLHGSEGPLPMNQAISAHFRTYGPERFTQALNCFYPGKCPRGPLTLVTTNEVDLDSLRAHLKVSPAVHINWKGADFLGTSDGSKKQIILPGDFHPGTTYVLNVSAGVKDAFGQTSADPFAGTVRFDDLPPAMDLGSPMAMVESSGRKALPLRVTNLGHVDASFWTLSVPEAARFLASLNTEPFAAPRQADVTKTLPLDVPKNEERTVPIDLTPAVAGKSGLALVTLESDAVEKWRRQQWAFAQVTNLAVHLQIAPRNGLAWVTRLDDGQPVAGATVAAYDQTGKQVWSGTTDAQGLVTLPGVAKMGLPPVRYSWQSPFVLVVATLGQEVGVTTDTWTSGVEPYQFGISEGWSGKAPAAAGMVFADRGIYRPGEKVQLEGLVRFRRFGRLETPTEGSEFTLKVGDPDGKAIFKKTVRTTKYGTFHAALTVASDAHLGGYSVSAAGQVDGDRIEVAGSFSVAEYRAPRFKVDVQSRSKNVVAGSALSAQVFARYLFGAPMSNAKVSWSVLREPAAFSSDVAQGFSFGPDEWLDDQSSEVGADSSELFASGSGAVDAKGAFAVDAGTAVAPRARAWRYTLEATVTDVDRQVVAARTAITVHPGDDVVGLRGPTGFGRVGQKLSVETLVLSTDGKVDPGRSVSVTISRRDWRSIKKRNATGGFAMVSTPVNEKAGDCDLTSAKEAVGCDFTPSKPGLYVVSATVTDAHGRKQTSGSDFYVLGLGFVSWQRNDTQTVDLRPDRKVYAVGDVAHVLVKSPYPEARALMTVERDGVLVRKVIELKGSAKSLDVPITEDMVPNVYVTLLLMHGRTKTGGIESGVDPNRPAVRLGMTELKVKKDTKRLSVAVQPDESDYRPGDEVTVNLSVKDHQGRPAAGELVVWAVDESVLRLTNYQVPDPIEAIYPEQPLSVRFGEPTTHLVGARTYGAKGESSGGGGGGMRGITFRSNFKSTAYFNPSVIAGPDGKAQVRFKLPDNLTTYRIMAVAVGEGDLFGSGQGSVKVNKPLLALPALPRFARVGDDFQAGVVVHATGQGEGEVTVQASADGLALSGPAEQKVTVTEQQPKEVRFHFRAAHAGTATLRFVVRKGSLTDAVQTKIPIRLPVELETVATSGDTRDQKVEGVSVPSQVFTDRGGLTVTLSSTALAGFQKGFQQLVEYPYGCLEQQASRLVPFVALRNIAGTFGLPWAGPSAKSKEAHAQMLAFFRQFLFTPLDLTSETDPDVVVRKTIHSIEQLQDDDGAFHYWPGADGVDSWASAYATLALARAKDVGYSVDPEVLNKAEAYLKKVAGGECRDSWACNLDTQVFATYVLARAGLPRASLFSHFYDEKEKLSLFDTALLADAMYVGGGDRSRAHVLLQRILNRAQASPRGIHFEEISGLTYAPRWSSDTRTDGIVLQLLADISPDHPYVSKIAHWLETARRGDGTWRNTQEAAFGLMGLTELLRTKEKQAPDFVAKVLLGKKQVAQAKFSGRSMAVKDTHLSLSQLGSGKVSLRFSKSGTGVLYYSASLSYAPKQVPTTPVERGLYVQRWFEPLTGGGQVTRVYAGSLVRVKLRVATSQERDWTVFEVPLPAGLEAVDTSLSTTEHLPRSKADSGRGVGYQAESASDQVSGSASGAGAEWAHQFWSPFNHVEVHDTKVDFFADHLPPGVHVVSFVARATTPGTYVLRPAHGEEMYAPEVFGRSEGGTFVVELPSKVSERE